MASLQAYQSHGIQYYRIVESFRKNGKPSIRVVAHLGRVDDILRLHQQHQQVHVNITSVSCGAVTALHSLAQELDLAGRINRAIVAPGEKTQIRDELTEVRHDAHRKWSNPLRISSRSRRVYTTLAVETEAVGKADAQQVEKRFLLSGGLGHSAQSDFTAVCGRQNDVAAVQFG